MHTSAKRFDFLNLIYMDLFLIIISGQLKFPKISIRLKLVASSTNISLDLDNNKQYLRTGCPLLNKSYTAYVENREI